LLSITVPPEQPTILDRFGRILNGTAGPYEEGDAPYLTCRVTGGKQNTAILYTLREERLSVFANYVATHLHLSIYGMFHVYKLFN